MSLFFRKRLMFLLLAMMLALSAAPVTCAADGDADAAQPQPAESPTQKTPMQRFLQSFALIEATYNRNNSDWEELNKQYAALKNLASGDDYLAAVLSLTRELSAFASHVDAASQAQMDFKSRLERYTEENMLLQQELTQVSRYMNQLLAFGKTQSEQLLIAERTIQYLKTAAAKIPPPAQFNLPNGMVFQLVSSQRKGSRRTKPFYALLSPVTRAQWKAAGMALPPEIPGESYRDSDPIGNITLRQALTFQAAFSHSVAGKYLLPSAEHIHLLSKDSRWQHLPCAIWLGTSWDEEYPLSEAAKRFGVKWAGLWDPSGVLGGTLPLSPDNPGLCPEVPQAAYRQLGCLLVTDVSTGIAIRATRIQELAESRSQSSAIDSATTEDAR